MQKKYSQSRAMLAITGASLKAIFRSPSAVIFSFVFPLIFILVFGFIGSSGRMNIKIAFSERTDTTNEIYRTLSNLPGLNLVRKSPTALHDDLEKGRLSAIINIRPNEDTSTGDAKTAAYTIDLKTSDAVNPQNIQVLRSIMDGVIKNINQQKYPQAPSIAVLSNEVERIKGRTYRTIDFILPGQLGFSLLSAGVFGVAFIFYNLRQTLVLKRFFATPIRRSYIVFGEAISRVIFQIITAVVILVIGHFAFKFTLVHGFLTFMELVLLSLIGLIVFMGFGFVVSGLARNESAIPPFANLIVMPQFLLAGTFFSIDVFPSWLQPICRVLPLTHLNDAMRNVAFEGAHITDCVPQLLWIGAWGIAIYLLAIKVFRWE